DARRGDGFGRDAPMGEVTSSFFRRWEIVIAGLIDPKPVRLKVRRRGHLFDFQAILMTKRSDNLRRKEVGIDDEDPRFAFKEAEKRPQIQLLHGQSQSVAAIFA